MKIIKGLGLFLSCSLFLWPTTSCSAAQLYQISDSQLQILESNNEQLLLNNKTQLMELSALQEQVKVLQQELASSKEALKTAQRSLNKMQEYTKILEQTAGSNSRLMLGAGYSYTDGYVLGLKYKINKHLEAAIIGNQRTINLVAFIDL